MTFNAKQEATEVIGETEFYEFDFGDHTERYSTSRRKVVYQSNTYFPLPLRREGVKREIVVRAAQMKLTLPIRTTFTGVIAQGGVPPIAVKIIRGFGADHVNDYKVFFLGDVAEINVGASVMEVRISSIEALLTGRYPKVVNGPACNNRLYDGAEGGKCQALENDFTTQVAVVAVSTDGRTVTTAQLKKKDGSNAPVRWYQLGKAKKIGSAATRFIIDQADGFTLLLHARIPGLAAGDVLIVNAGCDKRRFTCGPAKFDVYDSSFVGAPDVPYQDPVLQGF